MMKKKKMISYKDSGVDIIKANDFILKLTPLIKSTHNKSVLNNFGGYSSVLDIKKLGYKDPLLLSTTDGVGTKLKLAVNSKKYFNLGIDLVAMCVNDIIAQGGTPHFFMDYLAVEHLDTKSTSEILKGIIKGCNLAKCSLVGGETAEMPGHYEKGNLDLAGFCIGAVERKEIFKKSDIKEKDLVIAIESNGVHSNG